MWRVRRINLQGNVKNNFTNFAPRLGIAYQATPKTVVRLGYGRSFDIGVFGSIFGHTATQNLPVLVEQQVIPSSFTGSVFDYRAGRPRPAFPVRSRLRGNSGFPIRWAPSYCRAGCVFPRSTLGTSPCSRRSHLRFRYQLCSQ